MYTKTSFSTNYRVAFQQRGNISMKINEGDDNERKNFSSLSLMRHLDNEILNIYVRIKFFLMEISFSRLKEEEESFCHLLKLYNFFFLYLKFNAM